MGYSVIVAARMGSSRLPGKALMPLGGAPMIVFLLRRLAGSVHAQNIILATSGLPADDELAAAAAREGTPVFRGDHEDVVARYVACAGAFNLDRVVRVTGDCPFVDGPSLDYFIKGCRKNEPYDLATTKGIWPIGITYEAYQAGLMEKLHRSGKLTPEDREHLVVHMHKRAGRYRVVQVPPPPGMDAKAGPFTVDTMEDYQKAARLVESMGGVHFSIKDLLAEAAQ